MHGSYEYSYGRADGDQHHGLILDCLHLPSWDGILANCGAARGEDSLLQSPAECGRMHAPVDSETDLTLAV